VTPSTVCHRTLTGDLAYTPQAKYNGQTLYFCFEVCLRAFLEDPDRFLAVHGKDKTNLQPSDGEYSGEQQR
jgi:YHS domain-containing protein